MTEKWYAKEMSDGLKVLYCVDVGPGLPVVYPYTAEEHAEVEKLRALYRAINPVIDYAGAHGSIRARGDRMQALMDVIYALDGGTYNPKIGGQ